MTHQEAIIIELRQQIEQLKEENRVLTQTIESHAVSKGKDKRVQGKSEDKPSGVGE